jgi:hypothetical protein
VGRGYKAQHHLHGDLHGHPGRSANGRNTARGLLPVGKHEVMLWVAEKPALKAIEHQLFEENESERFC